MSGGETSIDHEGEEPPGWRPGGAGQPSGFRSARGADSLEKRPAGHDWPGRHRTAREALNREVADQ